MKKVLRRLVPVLVIIVIMIAAGAFCAPGFLLYETKCEKADAIVLLLGPDFNARHRHAQDLMQNGMSDYLIIPAYHKTYYIDQGIIRNLNHKPDRNNRYEKNGDPALRHFEDTHLELLEARRIMESYGKKSVIFVSSPYHMRRIHLIADRVFAGNGGACYSPTPYEAAPKKIWQFKPSDWKKVWREYLKICWFMIYSRWENQ